MDIAIWVLSILSGLFFMQNQLLKRKIKLADTKQEENAVEKRLIQMSAEQLKIKNDVDRAPLDELINRKRDSGDNT